MTTWRLAKSLVKLRTQVNKEWPNRNKASDGTVLESVVIRWYYGDMKHCKIESCKNLSQSKGWCKPHYDAWYRKGDPLTYKGDRSHLSLWDKIQEVGFTKNKNGCLEYKGYRNEHGYGQFRDNRGLHRVHRVVYKELVGELDTKEEVMHLCDNPACSEITHLRKGTHKENMADMSLKDRFRSCKMDSLSKWTFIPQKQTT